MRLWAGMLAAALLFAGCQTAYAPNDWTGGYNDKMIDPTHYRVSFFGNGNTSEEKVWNYWIYRCAEVTKANGFAYFSVLMASAPTAAPAAPAAQPTAPAPTPPIPATPAPTAWLNQGGGAILVQRDAVFRPGDAVRPIQVAHSGGTTTYAYVPGGGNITRWNTDAVVTLYRDAISDGGPVLFRAQDILDALHTYVKSSGAAPAPNRFALLAKSAVVSPLTATFTNWMIQLRNQLGEASKHNDAAPFDPPSESGQSARIQATPEEFLRFSEGQTWTQVGGPDFYVLEESVAGIPPGPTNFVAGESIRDASGVLQAYQFDRYNVDCTNGNAERVGATIVEAHSGIQTRRQPVDPAAPAGAPGPLISKAAALACYRSMHR